MPAALDITRKTILVPYFFLRPPPESKFMACKRLNLKMTHGWVTDAGRGPTLFFFQTRGCEPLLARDKFFTGSLLPFFISFSVIHPPKSSDFSTKNKITVHFDVDGRSVIVRQFPELP
jgi:hypothetical protein